MNYCEAISIKVFRFYIKLLGHTMYAIMKEN